MSHTASHDEYFDKLHRLQEHIKAHPDEARAGVAKLSTAAQKPAGDLIKNFVSGKDAKVIFEENQKLKASLSAPVRAEIDQHIADLAHKIGLLTLHEIVERLEKLAAWIKSHPEESRAKIGSALSPAAQKPFGEMVKIFVSDKTAQQKFDECRKIKDSLPSEVVGEINALKEELAKKIGLVPIHHWTHTPSHIEYLDKLHRLVEHIKAHPDEARAGVAKLSAAAQKPAGDLIKNFCSGKDALVIFGENQRLKAALPAAVRAEIDAHLAEVAHKIGVLTLHEIVERLEKLAEHIKSHPDEARAKIGAALSPAAQKPFGEMVKIFVSDKPALEKFLECRKIKDSLPAEVVGEINALKEELALKIGIVPIHHLVHTHSHDDYLDKLHRLAEHIKAHPEEARAGVAKMSADAQKPAGDLIKNFCSGKDAKVIFEENQKLKASLSGAVRAEIDQHLADLAHKIGLLTLSEILERLEKLAAHIKTHPDEARAKVGTLSTAAQKPFGDMVKILVSDKTPKEKFEECKHIRESLPLAVQGEINALKDELATKIGIVPIHHH